MTRPGSMAALGYALVKLPAPFFFEGFDQFTAVYFNGGSVRRFRHDKSEGGIVPIPDTAVDAHGNILPEHLLPAGRDFMFNGPKSHARDDQRNVMYLFPGTPPPLPAGGCRQINWNGTALTCVRPF